jgi:hypothetical protein
MQFSSTPSRVSGFAGGTTSRPRAQPNTKHFEVRRIVGSGDLWITELVMTYDGQPFYTVSIMEFSGAEVVRETQYFTEAFEAGPSRAQWVERM